MSEGRPDTHKHTFSFGHNLIPTLHFWFLKPIIWLVLLGTPDVMFIYFWKLCFSTIYHYPKKPKISLLRGCTTAVVNQSVSTPSISLLTRGQVTVGKQALKSLISRSNSVVYKYICRHTFTLYEKARVLSLTISLNYKIHEYLYKIIFKRIICSQHCHF